MSFEGKLIQSAFQRLTEGEQPAAEAQGSNSEGKMMF